MLGMTGQPSLLIVDDDAEICDLLAKFLTNHGFEVETAANGAEMFGALERADTHFDLVVLDIMMPGEDGLSLCRRLRGTSDIPVIMLTAMGEDVDRIVGLEMGADDYLPKPFNPRELMARVKAVLRRVGPAGADGPRGEPGGVAERPPTPTAYVFDGWRLDTATRSLAAPDGRPVELSAGEYDLLLAFVEHPRRVLNRDQLLDLTRGRAATPFDRSVDIQVSRLRKKVEPDPKSPEMIKTVRGGGYMFTPEVRRA